jgi:hypothetical protein
MLVALPLLALLPIAAAFALASGAPSRGKILAALEQPAAPAPSQHTVAIANAGPYRLVLDMGPNRASVANGLSLRISDHGRAVGGAHVTVGFSMPSMNMWHAYTSRLAPGPAGSYRTAVPILGMSGTWQLRVHVTRPGAAAITVNVNDRLGA